MIFHFVLKKRKRKGLFKQAKFERKEEKRREGKERNSKGVFTMASHAASMAASRSLASSLRSLGLFVSCRPTVTVTVPAAVASYSSASASVPEQTVDGEGGDGPYDPSKDPNMMSAKVNGKEVWVPKGSNVMAACEAAGIDIPRFCYHPKLSIAGNCRYVYV